MLKGLVAGVVVVGASVVAVTATRAQDPPRTTAAGKLMIAPARAGTPRRPAGVKLAARVELTVPEGQEHPILTGFELWHGPGLAFDGRQRAPTCAPTTLRTGGPSACPPKSIMGNGRLLGQERFDDFGSGGSITVINAPGGRLMLWMVLLRPARVRAAVISSTVDGARGRWPHRDVFVIPRQLQVVAGIPITLPGFDLQFGGKSWAKDYTAATDCPKGGWAWRIRLHLTGATRTLDVDGRAGCR